MRRARTTVALLSIAAIILIWRISMNFHEQQDGTEKDRDDGIRLYSPVNAVI
jgi:uncharacterized membrane protein YqjE